MMVQFAKYLAVGLINSGIGYAIIFGCMYGLGMSAVASNFAGYAIGMVISYSLNRVYTFKGTRTDRATFLRFCAVTITAYCANLAALLFMMDTLKMHAAVAQGVAGVVYLLVSFLVHKTFVFRTRNKPIHDGVRQ